MNDKDKTKAQLIEELAALRQQVEGVDETFASSFWVTLELPVATMDVETSA